MKLKLDPDYNYRYRPVVGGIPARVERWLPHGRHRSQLSDALRRASENGDLAAIRRLRPRRDGTALQEILFRATLHGHFRIVAFLCQETGVDANGSAYFACENGHLDCLRYLVEEHKVDVDGGVLPGEGLYRALLRLGHMPVVTYLLEKKKAVLLQQGLRFAIEMGNLPIVQYGFEQERLATPHSLS